MKNYPGRDDFEDYLWWTGYYILGPRLSILMTFIMIDFVGKQRMRSFQIWELLIFSDLPGHYQDRFCSKINFEVISNAR